MNGLNKFLTFIVVVFCSVTINSCDNSPCLSEPKTSIGIEFCNKDSTQKTIKPYSFEKVTIVQKRIFEEVGSNKPINGLGLLYPTEADSFYIVFKGSAYRDSIWFSYNRTISFSGESCGFYYGFNSLTVKKISGNNFVKTSILSNEGDSTQKVHVRIFW